MFSSRLPPPKKNNDFEPTKLVEFLVHDFKFDQPNYETTKNDEHNEDEDEIASGIKLNSLIPIRAQDFNMEIPLPSKESIRETMERTQRHFQELLNPTENDTVIVNGRKINVIQKKLDPLMPRTSKVNKKKYVPNNEVDMVQPQLRDNVVNTHSAKDWQIPSVVSQWKNPNGFTTLQRLQNDTSVLKNNSDGAVNDKFSQLSKALDEADKNARKQLQIKNEKKLKLINKTIKDHDIHSNTKYNSKESFVIKDEVVDDNDSKNQEVTYDSRLFMKGAISSNHTQIYDSTIFQTANINHIYRDPKQQTPIRFTKSDKDEQTK